MTIKRELRRWAHEEEWQNLRKDTQCKQATIHQVTTHSSWSIKVSIAAQKFATLYYRLKR